MRGTILMALSVLLLANICVAQADADDGKKYTFGYDYGISLPVGDYAGTSTSKFPLKTGTGQDTAQLSGYAKTGFHYDMYFAYKIIPYVSLMLAVYGDQSNYNINTLNSQYKVLNPNSIAIITTGDNYYAVQYLLGPYVNIPVNEIFVIEVKALAGLTTCNYPSLDYIGAGQTTLYSFTKGSGFGYTFGAGAKLEVADGLYLHLNFNYAGSDITYSSSSIAVFSGNNYSSTTNSTAKTMGLGIFQITGGVSMGF
ncbi:MAG: hypothetical protein ACLQQ4_15790 [Bacteroidia bacterium]